MRFSKKEKIDLFKSWSAITLAFAILLKTSSLTFLDSLLISSITVGTGFLFHELAHKKIALNYKCKAKYKSFDLMLILAVAMSFFGFLIAAPGAVFITKNNRPLSKKQNGKISAAGPLMNIIIAIIFLPFIFIFNKGIMSQIVNYGYIINAWLALFNTLPFGPLDGKKIFDWDKKISWILIIISGSLILLKSLL